MIKTYKPTPIKPVTSEMWAPVSLTDWKLDGDGIIETQFEYTTKLNALFDRSIPGGSSTADLRNDKAFLNYQILPAIANYGFVTTNPAGSILIMANKKIQGTAALTETNITAYNAIASLINQQRTDLDLTKSVRNAIDPDYPIIPIYMRALMYNSQTLIKPALHIKSMFGYLESLVKVNNKAAIRITQILNKFKQNKFVKPYNEYLELLDVTPLHTETVNSMIDFFHIEKLNDAFNTSYDYVTVKNTVDYYHHANFNVKDVFKIQKRNGTTLVGPSYSLLLDNTTVETEYFANRQYIRDLYMMIVANDDVFVDKLSRFIDQQLINNCITMINKAISMISSMPTIFQAFYAALPFLAEYIDTSIFSTKKFSDLQLNIRRSSYYSKGNVMTNVELKESSTDSLYPTWNMIVPLYNGSLTPSAPFNTNGLLYFLTDNSQFMQGVTEDEKATNRYAAIVGSSNKAKATYIPFVDLTNMRLDKIVIASYKGFELESIFDSDKFTSVTSINDDPTTAAKDFSLKVSEVEFDNYAGAIALAVNNAYFEDVDSYSKVMRDKLSPLINWTIVKSDHLVIDFIDKNKGPQAMTIASPNLTGYRQVEITPVADVIRKATPKLLGMKKVLSV